MITCSYLLVLNVPLHRHAGEYWAEPLWKRDLEAHLAQIARVSIACPVEDGPLPAGWERLSRPEITVVPLPAMRRWSYLAIPLLMVKLWQAVSHATIVHTGVAGWPFPLGWIAVLIAKMRGRFLVLVVESAFWRIPPGVRASWVSRAKASLFEAINKACIRRCSVTFFTTEAYRDTLHPNAAGTAHIVPAVWLDAEQVIEPERLRRDKGGRLLFAGRLTAGKGVPILLDAIRQSGVPVDIVGDGELRDMVITAEGDMPHLVRLLPTVEYGEPFFDLLDQYAALVVPTVTDEQPRIIFDAFARGIPVLASDTSGNRQIVDHGRTGLLYRAGDSHALAAVLTEIIQDPDRLTPMALAAIRHMTRRTHAAMHAERAAIIGETLSTRP